MTNVNIDRLVNQSTTISDPFANAFKLYFNLQSVSLKYLKQQKRSHSKCKLIAL